VTRRALARARRSAFVRRDLADSWASAATWVGGITVGLIVLAWLALTHHLAVLLLAATQGALQ